jgi:methylenetetrahydrofolate dehydrogenase (NADP+)/methenyltetrahydrofolate cyclohydrolase
MIALGPHSPTPCAAGAAVEILKSAVPSLKGLEVVIIGHSTLVGKTIANMLLQSKRESATPTICHIATRDVNFHTRRADALIVAAGKAGLVRGGMIKPGAVVIDIGVNRTPEGKTVGDVVFEEAVAVAGAITPVPGGVGPVTLALLLRNIIDCARACS